ncbi:MAG: O-antigen ligase family protein [Candidatus Midichloriaceae bacterium]|jgi:O-antigen ligase|nr:O-antigen ligase family protein [Candidatus Midichloriaceae bacterium]
MELQKTRLMNILLPLGKWLVMLMPAFFALGTAAIDIALSLLVAVYCFIIVIQKDFIDLKQPWFLGFVALWIWLIIDSFFVQNIWTSLRAALPMLRFPLLALAIAYFINKYPDVKAGFFRASALVLIFLAANSFFQIIIGHDFFNNALVQYDSFFRVTTPTGKQRVGFACAFILVPLVGHLLDVVSKKQKSQYWLIISGIALGLLTVIVSGERMPIAITIFSIVVASVTIPIFRKKAIIAFSLVSLITAFFIFSNSQLRYRLFETTSHQLKHFSQDAYGVIYKTSFAMFLENKVMGIGTNQFNTACPNFIESSSEYLKCSAETNPLYCFRCATHPHNYYLQIFTENGLIGISIFLIAIALLLRRILANPISTYSSWFAGMLVLTKFIPIVPSANFYIAWSSGPLWVLVGLALYVAVYSIRNKITKLKT